MKLQSSQKIRKEAVFLTALTLLLTLPLFLWSYFSSLLPKPPVEPVFEIRNKSVVYATIFSADGGLISAAGNGIQLYDWKSDSLLKVFGAGKVRPLSVDISPDGKTIASGQMDATIKLWSVTSGQLLKTLYGHTSMPHLAFSPDGKYLASGSWSKNTTTGEIRLWDIATSKMKLKLPAQKSYIADIRFSPDSQTLISAGGDKTAKLWDVASGKLKRTLRHDDGVLAVAVASNGQLIASGGWDKTVKIWDAQSGSLLRTLTFEDAEVRSIDFSHDSKTVAVAASRTGVELYNVQTGALGRVFKGHKDLIFSTAFSPDGTVLASGGTDGLLKLWRIQ